MILGGLRKGQLLFLFPCYSFAFDDGWKRGILFEAVHSHPLPIPPHAPCANPQGARTSIFRKSIVAARMPDRQQCFRGFTSLLGRRIVNGVSRLRDFTLPSAFGPGA